MRMAGNLAKERLGLDQQALKIQIAERAWLIATSRGLNRAPHGHTITAKLVEIGYRQVSFKQGRERIR